MTTVAVLCDPPRPGLVLPHLPDASPLSAGEAADLYAAMLQDVAVAVDDSGGDLLVNYRPEDALPEAHRAAPGEPQAETTVRGVLADVLEAPGETRFEVQVGEPFAHRAGNTITHLLETEDTRTAAVVEPTAAFLARSDVDNAAMTLRHADLVIGPAHGGRVYYAGFAAPVDFEDAFAPPAVRTLTDRARDGGLSVGLLPIQPVIETGEDLATALVIGRARQRAGRAVPEHTLTCLEDLGVTTIAENGDLTVVR